NRLRPALAGAEHVAVREAAADHEARVRVEAVAAGEQIAHVDVVRLEAGAREGRGHLVLAVDALLAEHRDPRAPVDTARGLGRRGGRGGARAGAGRAPRPGRAAGRARRPPAPPPPRPPPRPPPAPAPAAPPPPRAPRAGRGGGGGGAQGGPGRAGWGGGR